MAQREEKGVNQGTLGYLCSGKDRELANNTSYSAPRGMREGTWQQSAIRSFWQCLKEPTLHRPWTSCLWRHHSNWDCTADTNRIRKCTWMNKRHPEHSWLKTQPESPQMRLTISSASSINTPTELRFWLGLWLRSQIWIQPKNCVYYRKFNVCLFLCFIFLFLVIFLWAWMLNILLLLYILFGSFFSPQLLLDIWILLG